MWELCGCVSVHVHYRKHLGVWYFTISVPCLMTEAEILDKKFTQLCVLSG